MSSDSSFSALAIGLQKKGICVMLDVPTHQKERGVFYLSLYDTVRKRHARVQHTCSGDEELIEALQIAIEELEDEQAQVVEITPRY